jgi:multidrug transporter EmrE-like cation transporter
MFILGQFNLNGLGWAGIMGLIDTFVLSILKGVELGWIKWKGIFLFSMIIYSFQPLIFYQGLKGNGLAVMNSLWNVMSDIAVTVIGIFYFSENLSAYKKLGILLSFVSIFLLSFENSHK